ncbi:hypothetical protein CK203_087673 [Vitis vinifera]|uniref:Uncharacterized protein n=1 Tax=Vitis vinifera TaxID=29760 RepID=A0A438C857_VITVI|nr:hypothetical protein CK203_087673 [Vitis vinifera]
MTAYVAHPIVPAGPEHPEIPQDEQPQQAEIPTKIIASALTTLLQCSCLRLHLLLLHHSWDSASYTATLGILSPPEHDMPGPSEPTNPFQDTPPTEQTVPHEETTTGEIETPILSTQTSTAKPSSPHDPPPPPDHLSTFLIYLL